MFLVSESKLDSLFPINQFHIFDFKVFRRDRNRFGGGLILYINKNIPRRPLNGYPSFPNLELIAIEIHRNKRRWHFIGMYKPPSQSDNEFTNRLSLIIDYYSPKYENLILIRDFNLSTENQMHWYRLTIWITLLTNQHVSNLIHPHALTLYLPIRKICSNYPILLRLVFRTIIN